MLRLQVKSTGGFLFDDEENLKKKWSWSEGEAVDFQPFTITLNKQFTIKLVSHVRPNQAREREINVSTKLTVSSVFQENFSLTFSASKQNHIRFNIESKLKNVSYKQ